MRQNQHSPFFNPFSVYKGILFKKLYFYDPAVLLPIVKRPRSRVTTPEDKRILRAPTEPRLTAATVIGRAPFTSACNDSVQTPS